MGPYTANQTVGKRACCWTIFQKYTIFLVPSTKRAFIGFLAGDTNDLKLGPILDLSSKLKQCVQQPTRLNPPRMIDPIITTLSDYYQLPQCMPPLDADHDLDGKPSDHLMVVMSPVSVITNRPARITRTVA